MTVSASMKARKLLIDMIRGELDSVVRQFGRATETMLSSKQVAQASGSVAELLLANPEFLRVIGALAPATSARPKWLTTEQAAQLSGFSRPFIAALLDGEHFVGKVSRSPKGHRRVDADDFDKWMKHRSEPGAREMTLADARAGARFEKARAAPASAEESKLNRAARERSLAVARGMGLG